MKAIKPLQAFVTLAQGGRCALLPALVLLAAISGLAQANVPLRELPSGAVPNPGTQQQELTNITAPGEFNVFEFVVTCAGCHGGSIDQHAGHFGNWAGTSMASSARDPIFRANQIGVNNAIKSITGEDGSGNVCMRCHSPNGWLSGRFDPSLGGKADASNLIESILISTDGEGIMCETCHRVVGNVTYKRPDLSATDKVWNLLAGIFDWEHTGREALDQDGNTLYKEGFPYGDTSLQFQDGISYVGKHSGTGDVYFSDLPLANSAYTGQIYAVYPDWWDEANALDSLSYPMPPAPVGLPTTNSAGQTLAYAADGSLPPAFEVPIGPPTNASGFAINSLQGLSLEHPTTGSAGRKHSATDTAGALPVLPAGPGGSASPNEFIRTSEFCGSCHDLTVPVLNHGMPEQRTYTEWKLSSFAQTSHAINDPLNKRTGNGVERCQDCHMPTLKHEYADDNTGSLNPDPALAGGFPYAKDRGPQGGTTFHKLTGANRDLPMMMKTLYPEVDLEVVGAPTGMDPRTFPGMLSDRGPMWDRAQHNTEITLRDGVDVSITQAPVEIDSINQPGVYEMKVKVTNKSGHRIPSGYPDGRRFWLAVDVKDANGSVYKSGVYDNANAQLKTDDTNGFNRALSNVIDATTANNNAVMVYERVTGTCSNANGAIFPDPTKGTPTACNASPALTNNFILFDNRIPPKGLDYVQARQAGVKFYKYDPITHVPVEDEVVDDNGTPNDPSDDTITGGRYSVAALEGGYDEVTYRFTAPTAATLNASVDVMWQTHTREFMEHLRTQDTSTVRPQRPPNVFDPNYPNNPNYISDAINGQPLSAYTALDGSVLNDNWGGVAYASWLATGKGAPYLVDRDDTTTIVAPSAPANVEVSALTSGDAEYIDPVTLAPNSFAAKITWDSVANADGYTIWVRYGLSDLTADWDRLAVVGKDQTRFVENVLGHAGAGAKSYGFKVVAFNGKGEGASAPVTYTMPDVAMVAAPNNLTASSPPAAGSTANQITLTWNDQANNEVGFEVWRFGPTIVNGQPVVYTGQPPLTILGDPNGPVGEIGSLTNGPTGGLPTTGTNTFVDDGTVYTGTAPAPYSCYDYQVRAMNANFDRSTWTAPTVQGCTTQVSAVAVNAVASNGYRVDLSWNAIPSATGYTVTRSGGAVFTPVTVPASAAPTVSYADTSAQPDTTYTYTVTVTGAVANPGSATVTTPAVPIAPSNAAAVVNGTQVTVTWLDNANNESGFVVERAAVVNGVAGAYLPVPAVGAFLLPNTQLFVDDAAVEAQTSIYRVKAIHLVNGDSSYATSNTVTLGLFAPANLVATINAGLPTPTNVNVTVNWQDVSQKETAYKVERKIGGGAWSVVNAALPANSQQVADLFPVSPTDRTVQYRVTAVFGTLTSQAVVTSVVVPARPGTAVAPTINGATANSLNVNFTLPVNAVGYQLRRSSDGGASWTTLPAALATGSVVYTDTGLASGTNYQYQLKVANPGGWSANWSTTVSGTTLFLQPVANADTASVNASGNNGNQTIAVSVLANDQNVPNNSRTLTASAVTQTHPVGQQNVTASVSCSNNNSNCTLSLGSLGNNNNARAQSRRGTYTYTYTVTVNGQPAQAMVTVTVN